MPRVLLQQPAAAQQPVCNLCRALLADTVIFGIRSAFDKLRSVRDMEYELDFVTNRAHRDMQVGSPKVVFCCMHTLIEPDMSCHSGRRVRVLTSVYLKREQQSNM